MSRDIQAMELQESAVRRALEDDTIARLGAIASSLLDLRGQRAALLKRMEAVPGLSSGFGPTTASALRAAVPRGSALVYLVPSPFGGAAIVVRPRSISSVLLPGLTSVGLGRHLRRVARAYDRTRTNAADRTARRRWARSLDEAMRWLWDACIHAVLGACDDRDRIVLLAAGGMEFLPLHAAYARTGAAREYACDRQTISYAPAAGLQGRERADRPDGGPALVVGDPAPTSYQRLPGAEEEARGVAAMLSTEPLLSAEASAARVLRDLASCEVFHAACHGRTEFGDAYQSRLILACDTQLTVADVLGIRLTAEPSVFLSACETGLRRFELADEVQTLGASFLAAGASDVISTLWTVDDRASALFAVKFYDRRRAGDPVLQAFIRAQAWLRGRSNQDKAADIRAMGGLPRRQRNAISKRLEASTVDYGLPEYWAAFIYSGP